MKKLDLYLRHHSAYFSPAMFFVADNESLKINLVDCGQITHGAYLLVNGMLFAFDGKTLEIPSEHLKENNVCTLQDRDDDGNIIKSWRTDNLYRPPVDRAITEDEMRQFETDKGLLYSIEKLNDYIVMLATALAEAENKINELQYKVDGKYTVAIFNEKGETEQ